MNYERINGPRVNRMPKGDYGFQRNGQTGPGLLLQAVGIATFDGIANTVTAQTARRNGVVNTVTKQLGSWNRSGEHSSGRRVHMTIPRSQYRRALHVTVSVALMLGMHTQLSFAQG
jgi:hypothetical protein